MKPKSNISKNMVYRLPLYLTVSRQLLIEGNKYITAPQISHITNINVETVKKDLSIICHTPGNPRLGREADILVQEILDFGVYTQVTNAVLIGAGLLGRALLAYKGFFEWGLNICAAFDKNEELTGSIVSGKEIYKIGDLSAIVSKNKVEIAIITVPADAAQESVDLAVKAGVKAIWNFAPANINVPRGIILQNENMASSLSMLNYHLKTSKKKNDRRTKTNK